jgi:sec-independent protein translocase protein TatC
MFIAFGITFEVPILGVILVRAGIVSVEKLKAIRRYVLVGAFVIGAIFTPPDVVSQFMLAVPLYLLYELGILVAGLVTQPTKLLAHRPLNDMQTEQELEEAETRKRNG